MCVELGEGLDGHRHGSIGDRVGYEGTCVRHIRNMGRQGLQSHCSGGHKDSSMVI